MKLRLRHILILLLYTAVVIYSQKIYDTKDHLWKPAEDNVYLQEVSQKIYSDNPISSIASFNGNCYAVKKSNFICLKMENWKK